MEGTQEPSGRDAQRRQTRQRVFDAAIAEFERSGMADADVRAIAEAAGVARGTFYFHFPTKEHVLLELEQREEARLANELSRYLESPHDLGSTLAEVARLVVALEEDLGNLLFKDALSLHFSPTRPDNEDWTDHPLIVLVVREIERARDEGAAFSDVDPFHSAVFFLIGLYALLATTRDAKPARAAIIDQFVAYMRRGLEAR